MRINITAAASKGQTPFARREIEVEKDGVNVYLALPQASGVIAPDSAIAFGEALFEAAGFEAEPTSDSIPAGWSLRSSDGGMVLSDSDGVVRGTFRPSTVLVSV
jgi:hypothetical protein